MSESRNSTDDSFILMEEQGISTTLKILLRPRELSLERIHSAIKELKAKRPKAVTIDLTEWEDLPTSLLFLLGYHSYHLKRSGIQAEILLNARSTQEALKEAEKYWENKSGDGYRPNPFEVLEGSFMRAIEAAKEALSFAGELVLSFTSSPFKKNRAHRGTLTFAIHQVGVGGITIVCLISVLLGLVMAFMSAIQLRQFGAQVYVASLLTLAMTRELGPIMTGILIAGRSGSSFASELGTMKLNEEIDALKSMGFDVTRFLVLPKMLATAISMPILSLFSQFSGIIGGLFVSVFLMGITSQTYWDQVKEALRFFDIWWGSLKCVVFGLLVAGIGCYEGLKVEKGAVSVGQAATKAVVKGIFAVILFDSIFAIILVYW